MRIYVDVNAVRNGNGTEQAPFRKINDAAKIAQPGDEVLVFPGTYREYVDPVSYTHLERHGKNGNIGYGFLTGSCQREGTVATTFFHDHHNLFVAGSDPEDMLFAVQRIGELQGGFLTVKDGQILSELALPVCGILSEASIEATGSALKEVRESLIDLGYEHHNPIMSVGTLGLPVRCV